MRTRLDKLRVLTRDSPCLPRADLLERDAEFGLSSGRQVRRASERGGRLCLWLP